MFFEGEKGLNQSKFKKKINCKTNLQNVENSGNVVGNFLVFDVTIITSLAKSVKWSQSSFFLASNVVIVVSIIHMAIINENFLVIIVVVVVRWLSFQTKIDEKRFVKNSVFTKRKIQNLKQRIWFKLVSNDDLVIMIFSHIYTFDDDNTKVRYLSLLSR